MRQCKECGCDIVGRAKQAKFCTETCKRAGMLKQNPSRSREGARKLAIKYKYNLEWSDYQRMHEESSGGCEICGTPLSLLKSADKETAFVDHCHETGKVRGILCNPCNRGLGYFRDSRLHLQQALNYLEKHDVDSGRN